ncbi:dihydroorotase [Porphyromonadaceae bacterium COT-184 OH4590]|nr:dihydroorotase [Porphyromonadaceae bacterium COT-184 OH4590]MDO4725671.1 dihydroorotase [Porphyromonadaceae bacterium]
MLFKNGILNAGKGFVKANLRVTEGKISQIGNDLMPIENEEIIDISDKILLAGFVDVHVHFREPGFGYKETIESGSMAAAAGGYTTVCTMPNLNPAPDCLENIQIQKDIIKNMAKIKVLPLATITKGQKGRGELVDFNSLRNEIGFSDDGLGVQSDELMKQAMEEVAKFDGIIVAHCEVEELVKGGYIHDGEYCRRNNHKGICSESEWLQIERDVQLAKETGCRYHVCHISTKESVDIIRRAKAEGVKVTCETAPHYLLLCDEDLQDEGRYKMNPPIRTKDDRKALIEGLLDGTIDMIATDHAPHSAEEKARGLARSAFGIVGLETAFALIHTYFVKEQKLSWEQLIEILSINPRKVFGLAGGLETGQPADITIIDPNKQWTINPEKFLSKGKATPFENWEVWGKVEMTFVDGTRVI